MTDSSPEIEIPKGRVLVTGGTGHLGANLVRGLLDDGHEVRCLVQAGADNRGLDGLQVERVEGDIRDYDSVKRALEGCKRVFHAAAKISTLTAAAGEEREIYEVNVIGTRNVMQAALRSDIARVVLTGSFSAVGYDLDDPSRPADESRPFYPFDDVLPYAHSKALAEHEMYKAVADGLDAVIATSCAIIGPNDFLPSRLGKVLCDYAQGDIRAYIAGGFDFVASRDIVDGHMRAMERGRTGNKYIISTQFMELGDLLQLAAEVSGTTHRTFCLPAGLMSGVAGIYSGILSRYFPTRARRLTPGAIRILRMRRHADTSKAQRELGFKPSSLKTAIEEAYDFFLRQGAITRGPLVSAGARLPRAHSPAE